MESTDKITDKRIKNLKPAWEKGKSGNENGRPKGKRNFSTIFYDALESLANKNGMESTELETEILEKALLSARKGDHRFFKDLMDRVHGQAQQKIDHTTDGKELPGVIVLPSKDTPKE